MLIRTLPLLAAVALAAGVPSQADKTEKKPAPAPDAQASKFYFAFYLERAERRFADAVAVYREFLAEQPEHDRASRAARQAHALLSRMGKAEEAAKLREKHAELFPAPEVVAPLAEAEPRGGAGRGRRGGEAPNLERLREQLAAAQAEGREDKVKELQQQIEAATLSRGEGRGGRGQGGGRFGGRGGGMRTMNFAEMSDDEIAERLDRMEGFMDRMLERLNEEDAIQVEESWKKMRKALEAKKKDEAQKLWEKIRAALFGGGV